MRKLFIGILVVGYAAAIAIAWPHTHKTPPIRIPHEVISVVNRPGSGMSNAAIKRDIPAWEAAANGEFSRVWNTRKVRIRLVKHAPARGIVAIFQNQGDVRGALAYHTVVDGYPRIVVYSGVGNFYGFNNSVSFTHELFEYLADPSISIGQQGWPNPTVWIGTDQPLHGFPEGAFWINEVCDPVEAYAYTIKGVQISDWITPNWFDDRMAVGKYDYMGKITEPQMILHGGYAQFWYGRWYAIINFRKASDRGFFLGEAAEHGLDTPAILRSKREVGRVFHAPRRW